MGDRFDEIAHDLNLEDFDRIHEVNREVAAALRRAWNEAIEQAAESAAAAWTDVASAGACSDAAECIRTLKVKEPTGD